MIEVVSIKFKNRGKCYFFSPNGLEVHTGDRVIVETSKGLEIADCVRGTGITVISDEVYERLVYDDDLHHTAFATLPGMAGQTVTISSAAKGSKGSVTASAAQSSI